MRKKRYILVSEKRSKYGWVGDRRKVLFKKGGHKKRCQRKVDKVVKLNRKKKFQKELSN